MKKILLLGGTGAMGVYLAPELLSAGYEVHITSRSPRSSDNPNLRYIKGDAHDNSFLAETLKNNYDAVVDFMSYDTQGFSAKNDLLLQSAKHYIFLSTYRVFADSPSPITERSARLLDISDDKVFLKTDEYALTKARQENILRKSARKNWTILRPTITYSKKRFQLGTMEANTILPRAAQNLPVILPKEMLSKYTTMTWAGDAAKMICRLVLNPAVFSEDFNVCTAEHNLWQEVAGYYKELTGLQVVESSLQDYIKAVGSKYQIIYDRMYNRVMDNSKILAATGMKQESLMPLKDGLAKELADFKEKAAGIKPNFAINGAIDRITKTRISLSGAGFKDKIIYICAYAGCLNLIRKAKSLLAPLKK